MNEWTLLSWLLHQLVLDHLICTLFRPWFLSFCGQLWDKKHYQKDEIYNKYIFSLFMDFKDPRYPESAWIPVSGIQREPEPMICWKPFSEPLLSLLTTPLPPILPPICPWLPHTNHQVFFDLFTDHWYFIFPILQRQIGFTVLPAPVLEERIVQFSVGHHEGAKAITGKILEDMCALGLD